jgi:hypothetical protein
MILRKFSPEEQEDIILLAIKCSKKLTAQPLIEYFDKIYRNKFENNGNFIPDTIINKYYPNCDETMRDNLHEIMLEFVFEIERLMEQNKLKHFRRKIECKKSPDGKHHPCACSSDPTEGYCCKFCGKEMY